MKISTTRVVFCWIVATALLFSACVKKQYVPRPISPPAVLARLESRRLDAPGLKKFLEANQHQKINAWPLTRWNFKMLALAAIYFSPVLQTERARLQGAEAAIVTAGMRPNPRISITPGVPAPYLLGLNLAIPFQTAGKRGYRVEYTKALSEVARLNLAEATWRVRSRVRAALLDYVVARRRVRLLRSRVNLLGVRCKRLGQRLKVGEIARSEVEASRLSQLNAQLAFRAGLGRRSVTRTRLAAAVGLPVSALDGVKFAWPGLDRPPSPQSLTPEIIKRQAVLNRLDVRRRLADYAATEAALRLQIAKQRPNFNLGPGYQFEEGNNYFTLGFSAVLPIFNHNQGPIAEAEALRKKAAAQFLATQAKAIAEGETALSSYRSAFADWRQAGDSLIQIRQRLEPMARQSVALGEADWTLINGVRLQALSAANRELSSFYQVQSALGRLEDAVERPLGSSDVSPVTTEGQASIERAKEAVQ